MPIHWTYENSKATFQGELSIHSIDNHFEKKTISLFHNKNIEVDLIGVNKVDTAGLAWLLLLVEEANKTRTKISFHNVPSDLLKLAKLSAVDLFLPITN